jgi:hypothetical protein
LVLGRLEVSFCAVRFGDECDGDGLGGRGEAMLDGKVEGVLNSDEVCVAVAESVEVAGAAEGLPEVSSVLFAHVMHEDNGGFEGSLDFSEEAEDGGYFSARIFVGAVQPDEGVEDEELWFQSFDSAAEFVPVAVEVEPERRGVDEVEVEGVYGDAPVSTDAQDAFADTGGGVFGEIDESGAFFPDFEASEAWSA